MAAQEDREFIVKMSFDETLARHMASNADTQRQGLPEIPIGLGTISSLILLAERESELTMSSDDPPERYTRETFIDSLEDMGLCVDETVHGDIDGMIHNGLIGITPEGGFQAKPSAMDLAKQVEDAFPGMPGMNLVAYLVQTIDEVLSGRKKLDQAIRQLDQTLVLYGTRKPALNQHSLESARTPSPPSTEAIKSALSASLRKRRATQQDRTVFSEKPKVVTASGEVISADLSSFSSEKERPLPIEETPVTSVEAVKDEESAEANNEVSPMTADQPFSSEPPDEDISGEYSTGHSDVKQRSVLPETDGPKEDILADDAPIAHEDMVPEVGISGQEETRTEIKPVAPVAPEETVSANEDDIQASITDFEQQLAMACPVCKTGQIQDQKTGKGKVFYNCTNDDCFFVSWGKPYHQECPRCKNPFLVESTGGRGNIILRCPRATCRYHEPMPGEKPLLAPSSSRPSKPRRRVRRVAVAGSGTAKKKKRVIRRRVVRKKG